MLKVRCTKCHAELHRTGALLFAPPDDQDRSLKRHLCVDCYGVLVKWLISITCPHCKKTSYNVRDVVERYCGNCHVYLDD